MGLEITQEAQAIKIPKPSQMKKNQTGIKMWIQIHVNNLIH